MAILVKDGISVTDTDLLALEHDLIDSEAWVQQAVTGKIAACRKRMVRQWVPRLLADPAVASIPGDEDSLISLVVARPDYKKRVDREETAE